MPGGEPIGDLMAQNDYVTIICDPGYPQFGWNYVPFATLGHKDDG
jgi:hypothetical protein